MRVSTHDIAGLRTLVIEADRPIVDIVLLHGYAMQGEDFSPFAHSMSIAGRFFIPTATMRGASTGYSWWNIDEEQRLAELKLGPRDLVHLDPPDRAVARETLIRFCNAIRNDTDEVKTSLSFAAPLKTTPLKMQRPLIVCGFSQGGMLACDAVLCGALKVDGLALLSSSRIALNEWQSHGDRVRNLPVLVSHGDHDTDLAFSAGEALKDFHEQHGALITWLPFEGGHQIPLTVWRGLRKFILSVAAAH